MRIEVPKFEDKKALFAHLVENKKELIKTKKSLPVNSDNFSCSPNFVKSNTTVTKGKEDKVESKIIGNLANWFDYHQDVMLPNSWKKSISEREIYILKDHGRSVTDIIADTIKVESEIINLKDIGVLSDVKSSQALVATIEPKREYDEKVYELYKSGRIKEHSIGLQYIQMELAINDKEFDEEFVTWSKYYDQIINKEELNKFGYFWAIKEAKILEISAVLFGANPMTPTIETTVTETDKSLLKHLEDQNKFYNLLIK